MAQKRIEITDSQEVWNATWLLPWKESEKIDDHFISIFYCPGISVSAWLPKAQNILKDNIKYESVRLSRGTLEKRGKVTQVILQSKEILTFCQWELNRPFKIAEPEKQQILTKTSYITNFCS